MEPENSECYRTAETAAYLDGELDSIEQSLFETHLVECEMCARELAEQRRLLCALDFALRVDEPGVKLPRDFAQIVAANAESDMSGVRNRTEHALALRLCLVLAISIFALLGGAAVYTSVSTPVRAFAGTTSLIAGFAWNGVYDAGVGIAVVLRALARRLVFESHPVSLIVLLCFVIAIAILPRLIAKYHRTRITE